MVAHSARIDNSNIDQFSQYPEILIRNRCFRTVAARSNLIRVPPVATQKQLQFPHAREKSRPWRTRPRLNLNWCRRPKSGKVEKHSGGLRLLTLVPIQIAASSFTQKRTTTHTFFASQAQPLPQLQIQEPQQQALAQVILP